MYNVQERFLQYQIGLDYNFPLGSNSTGIFIEAGWMGNYISNIQALPSNGQHQGAFAGIGIHF